MIVLKLKYFYNFKIFEDSFMDFCLYSFLYDDCLLFKTYASASKTFLKHELYCYFIFAAVMFYAIGRELFSGQSPAGVHTSAYKLCAKNEDVSRKSVSRFSLVKCVLNQPDLKVLFLNIFSSRLWITDLNH